MGAVLLFTWAGPSSSYWNTELKIQESRRKLLTSHNILWHILWVLRLFNNNTSFKIKSWKSISATPASPQLKDNAVSEKLTWHPAQEGWGSQRKHLCSHHCHNKTAQTDSCEYNVSSFLRKPFAAKMISRAHIKKLGPKDYFLFLLLGENQSAHFRRLWVLGDCYLSVACFHSRLNRNTFLCVVVLWRIYKKFSYVRFLCHWKSPYGKMKSCIVKGLTRKLV